MRCLIAIDDANVRDAVATAAASFEGVEVDVFDADGGSEAVRRRRYDFGVVALGAGREVEDAADALRTLAPNLHLIALSPRTSLQHRRDEKPRLNLFALLGTPVDPVELYRTLRRVLERLKKPDAVPDSSPRE